MGHDGPRDGDVQRQGGDGTEGCPQVFENDDLVETIQLPKEFVRRKFRLKAGTDFAETGYGIRKGKVQVQVYRWLQWIV